MAELTAQERLQPALLDRLIDENPAAKLERREERLITRARLRQAVLRDLGWLLNATRLEAEVDMSRAPHARCSVINFGLPTFSGRMASSLDVSDLERAVKQAILDFEPRILPATLEVHAVVEAERLEHHNVVGVEIRGQLWAEPVPLELLLRTEIDLETGRVDLTDVASSRVG